MAFKPPSSSKNVKNINNLLITGYPGVGKTTCCKHLIDAIRDSHNKYASICSVQGFYSQENRKNYSRIGFDIVNINDGSKHMLARIESELPNHIYNKYKMDKSSFRHVGKYVVDLNGFEKFVLPLFKVQGSKDTVSIFVIDEIGKMELFSKQFENLVKQSMNNESMIVIATVPIKHINFVEKLKQRQDSKLFTLTRNNRNLTTTYITKYLFDLIDAKSNNDNNDGNDSNNNQQYFKASNQSYYRKKI